MPVNTVMDGPAILARLRDLVAGRIAVDPASLRLDAKLADIGIDSFSLIELVFVAEEAFGIKIPMEDIRPTTVGDVVAVIERNLATVR
jgi:acyl carrier protein